ncbi:OB-fold protein [Croceitalea rosinachiae]|uniref:tRNA_anti-like n=1 Tax=Croceitalea rosinachiae TaxID=3075596 RepID=A0ABU3AD11_9FLAO|nr:hypothetical protein [Croceitalea sp. F388]MDT0607770.1 hypothetical protein [Croceitalea sp. F388]
MVRFSSFLFAIVFIFSIFLFVGCGGRINEDLSSVEPTKRYSAENLISTLQSNKEYNSEEVIAVSGIVYEVNSINKRITILLAGDTLKERFVICDMNTSQISIIKTIRKGDSILIKGLLKGILKDVIMLNCVIEKDQ